jgi:hypothetical protein
VVNVALLGMRLLAVLPALYIAGLCAGNLHNARNWPEFALLGGGVVLGAICVYVALGSSTAQARHARPVVGVFVLYVGLLFVVVGAVQPL